MPSSKKQQQQQQPQLSLNPIYVALDAHQYSKAVKLSQQEGYRDLDIVYALRAHALERQGKVGECLHLIQTKLLRGGLFYEELQHRLTQLQQQQQHQQSSSPAAAAVGGTATAAPTTTTATAASSKRKKGKGKKSSIGGSSSAASPPVAAATVTSSLDTAAAAAAAPDLVEQLELVPKIVLTDHDEGKDSDETTNNNHKVALTDDTTLATVAVPLRQLRLYVTLYQMYASAVRQLTLDLKKISSQGKTASAQQQQQQQQHTVNLLMSALMECFTSGLRLLPSLASSSTSQQQQQAAAAVELCGNMQVMGMQLARYSSEFRHRQWAARAALWQHEYLLQMKTAAAATIAGTKQNSDQQQQQQQQQEEGQQQKQQMDMKLAMLPRLVENLSNPNKNAPPNAPSSEDWDLYFKALQVQEKWTDLLETLEQPLETAAACPTTTTDGGENDNDQQAYEGDHDDDCDDKHLVPISRQDRLELKADVLVKQIMNKHNDDDNDDNEQKVMQVYQELIQEESNGLDQWSYWKGYLDCCCRQHFCLDDNIVKGDEEENDDDNDVDTTTTTSRRRNKLNQALEKCESMVQARLEQYAQAQTKDGSPQNSAPRAPHLLRVEMQAMRLKKFCKFDKVAEVEDEDEDDVLALANAILQYATLFCSKASCTFMDLRPYLILVSNNNNHNRKQEESASALIKILDWCADTRSKSSIVDKDNAEGCCDEKEQRRKLRAYIIAVKITCQVVYGGKDMQKYLPTTAELLEEWTASLSLGKPKDPEQELKEPQPGDDLLLLAVQLIQYHHPNSPAHWFVSAALLECGLDQSPYSFTMQIAAMEVYAKLGAGARAWECYQKLAVRHIQLDSCSFLAADFLAQSGLYNELVGLSSDVLKLHVSTVKETGEGACRAMEYGTISKVDEFIKFQQEKMRPSLSLLHAKGIIMDCAPLFHIGEGKKNQQGVSQVLGVPHGIIGGDEDMERATNMIKEAHNHYGAPSIVTSAVSFPPTTPLVTMSQSFSDNRDFGSLDFQILHHRTLVLKDIMVQRSMQRGRLHGLLIRAVLCLDATSGPKKGKLQKPSNSLKRRCASLIKAASETEEFLSCFSARNEECSTSSSSNTGSQIESTCDRLHCASLVLLRVLASAALGTEKDDTLQTRDAAAAASLPRARSYIAEARAELSLEMPDEENVIILMNDNDNNNNPIATVCLLLPDCIVTLFASVELLGKLFTLLGWGKRKRHTKACAGALADVAVAFRDLVLDMREAMERNITVSEKRMQVLGMEALDTIVPDGFMDSRLEQTAKNIALSRHLTWSRVKPFLDNLVDALNLFDVPE